ncbi:MAG: hypothetical protein U0794_08835 [Isosphaeraceae bacterium]
MVERYGGLFYLGVLGLILIVSLVGWFAWSAWSMRSVWTDIYVLHDPVRSESERIQAAARLSQDERVLDRQRWEMALRRPLPPLARYVLAESITPELVASDSRAYGIAVSRSTDWPDWLRFALTRPIAYAATRGFPVDSRSLTELSERPEPAVALWSQYARVVRGDASPTERDAFCDSNRVASPYGELARLLCDAAQARTIAERLAKLDEATLWMRARDPAVASLWRGVASLLDGSSPPIRR